MRRAVAGLVLPTALLAPLAAAAPLAPNGDRAPLPGTTPLTWQGDLASNLVAGVDRFLLRQTAQSVTERARFWRRDLSSAAGYDASVQTNRARLAHILGVRDPRVPFRALAFVGDRPGGARVGQGSGFVAYAVRWPAFGDVHGEGVLLAPTGDRAARRRFERTGRLAGRAPLVIALPDADQLPEQLAGLVPGVPPACQYARRLAESGCWVIAPVLISRARGAPKTPEGDRGASLSNREFIYRPAYELGRHLIGYEIQKVLALVDWASRPAETTDRADDAGRRAIGVFGWGEGGLLALEAGALDPRLAAVAVSGYFDRREDLWREPVDRNVFGLLREFGDAELAGLVAPRPLIVEAARGPEVEVPVGTGGAPGRLTTPLIADVRAEVSRARALVAGLQPPPQMDLVVSGDGTGPFGSAPALRRFLAALAPGRVLAPVGRRPTAYLGPLDAAARQAAQMHELDRHNQWLLAESPYVRQRFMARLDTSSPERYAATSATYREFFADEVIGRFDQPFEPLNVRSRRVYDEPKWTGYEVVLDVFPDVFAYGLLLIPKAIPPGERRPVVVCQHGLEGRPQDTIGEAGYGYYKAFAARLAERGLVTFAPQNLYLFTDRFRSLQRKANPLQKTLYSIIVPQHQRITDWLQTLPFVDPARLAFYGLSYGGKTAMRVPALVPNYCLSICSGDFNDWVWKNASTVSPYSYVWGGEYEIFEFDLGSTFNYSEMAALIAPRPFMVERGHRDGVAPDETVAYEFAKVRFLYEARLGLRDRCVLEWFAGPHTIHGAGTFAFLARWLGWPAAAAPLAEGAPP